MAATAILPSAGVGAYAPTSTLVSMSATTAAGIYKALQATRVSPLGLSAEQRTRIEVVEV